MAAGALVLAAVGAAAAARAADGIFTTREHDFRLVTVVEGLEHPWGLAFLPDGRMLVTERRGRLRLIDNGALHPRPLAGVPRVAVQGQGGLLDVAIHPQFERNRWVYLSYAAAGAGGAGTEVARARLVGHRLEDTEIVFRALPKAGGGRHFGSRLLFGADGLLYITLGDRGERDSAQDPSGHPGSIIRVHADGSVPADNPLVGRAPARPEIFTYGNRNVQGIALQPDTGIVWAHEHGPQGGDELNVVRAGANYGWPIVTYGRNYGTGTQIGEGTQQAGMTPPVRYWVPSIAPSGMAFYSGDAFPRWRGDLFVGALKFRLLVRLEIEDGRVVEEERMLTDILGRIRDVRSGPDGFLYLLTDESEGVLARLEPVSR
ncbi:MAG: PQQ-dependent sugar dehydrogenase [Gammaproteobacteria bacterium]|nr:PQQ-dependent sugar dehydrogenase [Gammaproteobacteria bacterium]